MSFSEIVKNIVLEILNDYEDLFLIDLKVSYRNDIKLIIDGDNGVSLKDCAIISRKIEDQIDREKFNFSLEVTSVGIGSLLKSSRQYKKNVGRKLEVFTNESKPFIGELTKVNEDNFTIEWSQRESKPIGKGKISVKKNKTLYYSNVVSAKVVL